MKKTFKFYCAPHRQTNAPGVVADLAQAAGIKKHTMTYLGYYFPGEIRYLIIVEGEKEDIDIFEEGLEAM